MTSFTNANPRTCFLRATIFAVSVCSLAVGFTAASERDRGTSFTAKPRESTVRKYSSWMSRLPDTVLLSGVSLPGTHDSCALHNGLSLGLAKCQAWNLRDQLKTGIRFIDIRCRHIEDRLHIYHGVIDQQMTFREVRDVCRAFLEQHPTECIVMPVKEESTARDNSRSFAETFADAIENDGELWHINGQTPKLGTVRGRIVLVDRVGSLGGLRWNTMDRQDAYRAPLEQKAKLMRAQFDKALSGGDDRWFINFCSGVLPAGSLLTPRQYATQSNDVALDYVTEAGRQAPDRLGTVVMDFPSEVLIERIVETNFGSDNAE